MTHEEIIKYVMHTPENPNPRVLKDMLEQMSVSSSDAPAASNEDLVLFELTENDIAMWEIEGR